MKALVALLQGLQRSSLVTRRGAPLVGVRTQQRFEHSKKTQKYLCSLNNRSLRLRAVVRSSSSCFALNLKFEFDNLNWSSGKVKPGGHMLCDAAGEVEAGSIEASGVEATLV